MLEEKGQDIREEVVQSLVGVGGNRCNAEIFINSGVEILNDLCGVAKGAPYLHCIAAIKVPTARELNYNQKEEWIRSDKTYFVLNENTFLGGQVQPSNPKVDPFPQSKEPYKRSDDYNTNGVQEKGIVEQDETKCNVVLLNDSSNRDSKCYYEGNSKGKGS
jgi:hypothetical protein